MMSVYKEPPWTVGIEEEYLLVDKETRDLSDPPAQMLKDFEDAMPEHVRPEFLRSQVEVGTSVCKTVGEAKTELRDLRRMVAEIAGNYGLAPIAASTRPGGWDLRSLFFVLRSDRGGRRIRHPASGIRHLGGWSGPQKLTPNPNRTWRGIWWYRGSL